MAGEDLFVQLKEIRKHAVACTTHGLSEEELAPFINQPDLQEALRAAINSFHAIKGNPHLAAILNLPENEQIHALQQGYVNFYTDDTVNPYVPLAACGPWIITTCGAIVHDNGGYGMLGFGHAPARILKAMNQEHVMANVMTASFSQKIFMDKIKKEVGHRHKASKGQPFSHFLCLNSGSEAVTVAHRISDIQAFNLTATGAKYAGRRVCILNLKGGFHGRTQRPALSSDSSREKYRAHLRTFRDFNDVYSVEPNNITDLENAFTWAEKNNVWFELMAVEPVMGEGNPGVGLTREFYDRARSLTKAHDTLLFVDSIQAGLRAHGCLSITDYPGFEDCAPPDLETYSKAVNAGQYPFSVLALSSPAAGLYVKGVYGNTMTTCPRALDIACAVLDEVTPALRQNIVERGKEFVAALKDLQKEFPQDITQVEGTGLLIACHMNPQRQQVVGFGCLEEKMRRRGIGVIHGGKNALRFTPHFHLSREEITLVIRVLRSILKENP